LRGKKRKKRVVDLLKKRKKKEEKASNWTLSCEKTREGKKRKAIGFSNRKKN